MIVVVEYFIIYSVGLLGKLCNCCPCGRRHATYFTQCTLPRVPPPDRHLGWPNTGDAGPFTVARTRSFINRWLHLTAREFHQTKGRSFGRPLSCTPYVGDKRPTVLEPRCVGFRTSTLWVWLLECSNWWTAVNVGYTVHSLLEY